MSPLVADGPELDLDRHIAEVRRFNRFYTRRLGVLRHGYLGSPFSLAEVRVLYEIAHQPDATASQLAQQLDLDPGYLSRMLRRLEDRGLIERERAEDDSRRHTLQLSEDGRQEFALLDRFARDQIATWLEHVRPADQQRLVGAMHQVERILADEPVQPAAAPPCVLRSPLPGDLGWVVQRHGALYADEYGFNAEFEALVASIVAHFVEHLDPLRDRCWIAEHDGEPVGCVFLVKSTRTIGKLRLFLVEPSARGQGIGTRLVDECISYARWVGYRRLRLWTQSVLLAARHIYEKAGFVRIAEEPNHAFGQDLVSETWELVL